MGDRVQNFYLFILRSPRIPFQICVELSPSIISWVTQLESPDLKFEGRIGSKLNFNINDIVITFYTKVLKTLRSGSLI